MYIYYTGEEHTTPGPNVFDRIDRIKKKVGKAGDVAVI